MDGTILEESPPSEIAALAERIGSEWSNPALNEAVAFAAELLQREPDNLDALWVLGMANHNLSVNEVRGAALQAQGHFKKLLELQPDSALAHAYMGNSTILVARDSRNVMTKAQTVKRGLDFLDQAVAMAPDSIVIRQLRANSGRRLPKLFGRKPVAKEDFRHLLALLPPPPERAELRAEISYELALLSTDKADRPDRESLLRDAVAIAPDSHWARLASELLAQTP
jgi:tetratricopeptide (TPR) repeat protein